MSNDGATDVVIVGAGVVGLAIARALAMRGREVLVLEAEEQIGSVTSARNSGVIHAGMYYRAGSLKAKGCVRGRQMLYEFAATHGVAHRQCGKLVVATDAAQIAKLTELEKQGRANGVEGLHIIDGAEAKRLEPNLRCVAALHSLGTGIIDLHDYIHALAGAVEAHGGNIVLRSPVIGAMPQRGGFRIGVGGRSPTTLNCKVLINAAGLGAQKLAAEIESLPPATIPPLTYAKGSYFSLSGPPPFSRLIYPVPVEGSLGLHYSTDLADRVRFGPDIEWVDKINYTVDPSRAALFEQSIRAYWPALPAGKLQPDYAGVRPKLGRLSHHDSDFVIQAQAEHGVPGLINLYGIESPGLTSSLALAEEVAVRLGH